MTSKRTINTDGKGQFAPSQVDPKSGGAASAIPTDVTGEDDAIMRNADRKPSLNPGFDLRTQTNRRN